MAEGFGRKTSRYKVTATTQGASPGRAKDRIVRKVTESLGIEPAEVTWRTDDGEMRAVICLEDGDPRRPDTVRLTFNLKGILRGYEKELNPSRKDLTVENFRGNLGILGRANHEHVWRRGKTKGGSTFFKCKICKLPICIPTD